MKQFENLLISEIRKAEKVANLHYNRKDCKVTGYIAKKGDFPYGLWYEVRCEICFDYEERADCDVIINVYMDDRRRSFATFY